MDERTRKLSIAGVCAALFVGFIFLTKWTGDDPQSVESLGDQDRSDLENFCYGVASNFLPYETVLRTAVGLSEGGGDAGDIPGLDSPGAQGMAQGLLTTLVDNLPEKFSENGQLAAEGLERALDGDLDPDEIDKYVTAYDELQEEAAQDCSDVGVPTFEQDFDSGPADDGSFDDDGGSFGGDGSETTTFP